MNRRKVMRSKRGATFFYICMACLFITGIQRILFCIKYPVPPRDAFIYEGIIQQWNSTGIFPEDALQPPLGMFILRIPSYYLGYDVMKGGVIVNIILGLLFVWIAMYVSKEITESNLFCLFIGIITATNTTLVTYSCQMLRENSYLLFCIASVLFAIRFWKTKRVNAFIFMSLFSTMSFLCRHEGLETIILSSSVVILSSLNKPALGLKHFSVYIILCIFLFGLVTQFIHVPLSYYKTYHKEYIDLFSSQNE